MTQVRQWAAAAARQAVIADVEEADVEETDVEETEYLAATVEGCPGAWAYGTAAIDSLSEMQGLSRRVGLRNGRHRLPVGDAGAVPAPPRTPSHTSSLC